MARKPIVNLVDSFKLFTTKFNTLSNNVGDMEQLNTHQDSDLVTVINEIEAAFDASAGEILYPNGQTGETSTHLKISTNQSSGQDIDIDAGRDVLVDAVADIELTSVNFEGDHSGNYINKVDGTSLDSVGGAITVTGNSTYNLTTGGNFVQNTTGHIDLNASDNIILDAAADVILDAGDSDIFFRRNGTVFVKTQMGMSGNANLTRQYYQQGGLELDAAGNITLDASGDIILDAEANDIIFKNGTGGDEVTHNLGDNGTYTISAPANLKLDAVGDIVLDADGNDLVLRNGDGADSCRINLNNDATFDMHVPSDFLVDAGGDITLDAGGDNITLKDAGTTRQEYTLGATTTIATTGNRTETVTGNVSDSATGTYHIGATGNMDIDTRGTLDVVTGSSYTQTTSGTVNVNATQNITLNTDGDIVLDADGNHVNIKNGGGDDTVTLGLADTGAFTIGAPSTFTVDATGDIVLDAGDSDITFKRNGTEFARHRMGVSGADLFYRIEYSQGGMELDAAGDITLDAAGNDIKLKDNGTEFGKFSHIGDNQLGIYSNGILAVSFNDSDVVFNSDVNIEDNLDVDGTLNVDGATTLNGNVTLGDATGDDIVVTGHVASNIVPKTDNGYNLGSSAKEWKHGYFDGTVFADNLDGDSGTIANFNFNGNTAKSSAGLILDATNDITLNARGEDIVFKTADSAGISWNLGRSDPTLVYSTIHDRSLVLNVDRNIYFDAGDGIVQFRDSANSLRMQIAYTTATGTEIDVTNGSLTFDVSGDFVFDANGGDILLKDNNVQFGRFQNISNNLRIWSADSVAATFTGKNVEFNGTITPGTTLNTTATDLVGAINEVDSDLGERTSLSSFYDNHDSDIVSALNRVAARIIDVYDENGTLLNN